MEKIKDKLHKGDANKGESKPSDGSKKHETLGERLKEDEHKYHEYALKEEKMEADDNIWGEGPK
jgi:hypothetical protein